MTLQSLLDAVRVIGAIVLIFGVVPWRFVQVERSLLGWCIAAVRTALFVEISALALGAIDLCLPGAMAGSYLLFCIICRWSSGRPIAYTQAGYWSAQLSKAALFFDRLNVSFHMPAANWGNKLERPWAMPAPAMFLWAAAPALAVFWYPLRNISFLSAETYSRALSLQMLTLGQPVALDGSVAWLAPVVFLSGLDAATVIRFSGPFLIMVLAACSGAAIYGLAKSPAASLVAGALTYLVAVSPLMNGELGPGGIAAIFWLLALAITKISRLDALWAIGLALLIGLPDQDTLLCTSSTLLVYFFAPVGRRLPNFLRSAVLTIAISAILAEGAYLGLTARATSPHEYESVAAQVAGIARDFPHNRWLVISPGQELPFTYGRGWHQELSEFVQAYAIDQVRRPPFRFTFPVQTAFVFIEKRPLRTQTGGDPLYSSVFEPQLAYQSHLYREAMEFQAGELLAAYSSTHTDADIYFEDQAVIVYRIRMS